MQAKASKAGGPMKLRHPAPKSFMNRQEAIQSQIDSIMDIFDFQAVLKVLDVYKLTDRGYPEDWMDNGEFQEYLVRQEARECMKKAAKDGSAGISYFSAVLVEGEDDDGPWVKMDLYFGERTYQDGVSYEK
jgi:hypothetical protein